MLKTALAAGAFRKTASSGNPEADPQADEGRRVLLRNLVDPKTPIDPL